VPVVRLCGLRPEPAFRRLGLPGSDPSRLRPLACALRLPFGLRGGVGWLAGSLHPVTPFSRSRSARALHAGVLWPSANLWPLRCGVPSPVSGNPAWSLESVMTHDLFFSLDSFVAVPPSSLMVCDRAGEYRPAAAHEVLLAAQRVLAGRVRGSQVLASPTAVRDFLRVRLGGLSHEVFAVVHLDTQFQVLDYVEMFRGTVSQTSVYPREIVKEALVRNTAALLLVHNHPSGAAESLAHQGHV